MPIEDRGGRSAAWGVFALVFAGGVAIVWPMAAAADSTFPYWPTYVFGALLLFGLYMCFATVLKWWPVGESANDAVVPSVVDRGLGTSSDESAADAPAPLPATSVEPERQDSVEFESVPMPGLAPAVTDRWCYTSDGAKVPALMTLGNTVMSHSGYGGQQDTRPSVKIAMVLGCQQIDLSTSGSALRAKFVAFLNSPAVLEAVGSLTHVAPDASWTSLAGNGVRTLEAALTTGDDPMEGVPVASALFLPATGEALYGRAERTAALVLYVEPRTAEGQVPPASGLATWYRNLTVALAAPGAFADFLSKDLELNTFDSPLAQFGVWLGSQQPLTVMVDTQGMRTLPGRSPSNQFMGWTYADLTGKPGVGVARDLMVHLCEYTLHLDDFESALPEDLG